MTLSLIGAWKVLEENPSAFDKVLADFPTCVALSYWWKASDLIMDFMQDHTKDYK